MKKIIIFLFVLVSVLFLNKEENVIIPKESIRFRIIANSNDKEDQMLKWEVSKNLIPVLMDISSTSKNVNEASSNIQNNLRIIEKNVSKYTSNYTVNYGQNYFPSKTYHEVEYQEGKYNSLVITLGEGGGDNWWCVLFPPLCLLETKDINTEEIIYKSYVKEVINRYF